MTTINNDFIAECFNKSFMSVKGSKRVKLSAEQVLKQILIRQEK